MHILRGPFVVVWSSMALVLATGLVACSDDDGATTSIPVYHEGDSISARNGTRFVIALDANPSTGYSWDAEKNPNVELVSTEQVRKASSPPGAPGTEELTFQATAKGSSTLELAYARSFEPGVPPAETASFDVTVT